MARNKAHRVGLALTFLVIANISVALSEEKCRSGCQGTASQVFKYVPGTTYKYNVEGIAEVSVSSAEGQLTSIQLRATALLTALPQCDYLLRLQNVQVVGKDTRRFTNIPGIEKAIRFNFNDGRIDDSLCIEHGDTQNSLNIKRAVVSLFQASIKQHHETDIFGVCPTQIQTRQDGANFIIHKTRNLNKCAYRENIKQDFLSTTFNLNSEIKSSPLLSGEYSSEQFIKNGILDHATVTENYLYVPFSVGNNGAKATTSTKIQFVGTAKENPPVKVNEPRSIIFEPPHLVNTENTNVDAISLALKEAKNTIGLTVAEHTAKSFLNLIKILRASKKDDILAVYGQVKAGAGFKDKLGAKKLYLDALFRAGTGDTIEAAIQLLKSRELSPLEQKLVYLSMAFVKHATPASLNAAAVLLDQPDLPREAYLGVGILAGRYCREHPCKNVEGIQKLSAKLLSKLGDAKPTNRKAENEIINVLKAFGNFENLNDAVILKLIEIAQDRKASNRVRVVALNTYLTDACQDKLRDSALSILKDIQEDSEIRIKAYLAVAKCPNGKIALALKALLDQEPSHQVGGFIISHLRSLRASASPEKEYAKQQLSHISTTNRFPIDLRKYSFSNEFSYAIDSLGLASSVDSNVIYSYNDFLPRSASLNLTADIFGSNVHLLQLDFRQENLNRVMEQYFGPFGEFGNVDGDELLKTGTSSFNTLLSQLDERLQKLRAKRDISKAEIEDVNKRVQIKTNELNKDVDLDLSVKMFGSEFLSLSVVDDSEQFSLKSLINKIFDELDAGIAKAKGFDQIIQANTLFIDSEFSYPTSLGYGLRLAVEGTSSIQIKAASNVDIKAFLADQFSPIKLTLIPSANVEIRGSLLVDAQVLETGINVASTLYSAVGGDLDINFHGTSKGIDVKFSLPVEDQKILSATHEIVFNTRELGKPEVPVPIKFGQNKDFNICLDQLSQFIGLTLCVDINNPPSTGKPGTLPFPLSGNGKFALGIHRDDLSYFHFSHMFNHRPGVHTELILEAVGKNQNKKLNFNFEVGYIPETLIIKAGVVSPIKTASAEVRIISNKQEEAIAVILQHDNQKYSGKIGLAITGGGSRITYKPILYIEGPGIQGQDFPLKVEGAVTAEYNGANVKYIFDNVRLIDPNQRAIVLKGSVGSEPGAFYSDVTVALNKDSLSLNGKVQYYPDIVVSAEIKNSQNKNFDVKLLFNYKRIPNHLDTSLVIVHGPDLNSATNKISASSMFYHKRKGPNDFEGKAELKFDYPLVGAYAKFLHAVNPKNIKGEVDLKYGELKGGSSLDFSFNQKTQGDYAVTFIIYEMKDKIKIDATREIAGGEKSKVTNCIDINGSKFEVNGLITHHSRPDDINVGADLVVKIPSVRDPFKVENGLVLNPNNLNTYLKVTSGGQVYVDLFFKSDQHRNADGNIKVTLKGFLLVNGQLAVKNGVGNGNVIVEVPEARRKLKADANFNINDPLYKAELAVYPNYEADNSNKWFFSTNTHAKDDLIDSKNIIDICGQKLEVNFKEQGKIQLYDGKFTAEIDVTLPTQQFFQYKYSQDLQSLGGVLRGNALGIFEIRENKSKPGCKSTAKAIIRNMDLKGNLYDLSYNVVSECAEGNIFTIDYTGKQYTQGDQTALDEFIKITTPYVKYPIELSSNLLYKENAGVFTFKSTGEHNVLIKGKYDTDNSDKKVFGEVTGDIGLNYKSLKVIKFFLAGSVDEPREREIHTKGTFSLFVDDDGTKPEATIDYKVEGESFVVPDSSRVMAVAHVGKEYPFSIEYGYDYNREKEKISVDAKVEYAKDKVIKTDVSLYQPTPNEYKVDVNFDSPYAPNTKAQVYVKKSPDGQVLNGEFIIFTNNRKFVLTSELILIETSPGFTVKFVYPDGKTDIVSAKMNQVTPHHYNGDIKIVLTERDFTFENTWDAKLESIDNFHIKVATNAPAIKIDNLIIEAQNLQTKTGKRIQVTAKSAGQTILAGSTNYHAREESGKHIVEGSGAFKIYQETKQANFKFVSQKLTEPKNNEEGFEVSFNAGLGTNAIDTEFKITNRHFRILNSYCEEKQQCAYIEIDSKLNNPGGSDLTHELELAVDLRKLGLSHELGLKAQTTRKTFTLDHNVDMYFQNKENKYQYSVYVHPNDAGVTLTTPKRIIAFEANLHSVPHGKGGSGSVKGEIALYLNKKTKPNEKTAVSVVLESNPPAKKQQAYTDGYSALVKFTSPALGRDLSVSYVAKYDLPNFKADVVSIIDIFPNPSHKIIVNARTHTKMFPGSGFEEHSLLQAKSDGLNFDIKGEESTYFSQDEKIFKYNLLSTYNVGGSKSDSSVLLEANPTHAQILVKALNKDILNVNSNIRQAKGVPFQIDTNVMLLGVEPVSSQLLVKPDEAKYSVWRTSHPNAKLVVSATAIKSRTNVPTAVILVADVIKGSEQIDLFRWDINLNQDILQKQPSINSENIKKYVVNPAQQDVKKFLDELKAYLKEAMRETELQTDKVVDSLRKNVPSLKPVKEYYQREIESLKDELVSDKTIKEVSDFLRHVLGTVVHAGSDVFIHVSTLIEKIVETLQQQAARVIELINKEIVPEFTEEFQKILKLVFETTDHVLDLFFTIVGNVDNFVKAHKKEIEQITSVITGIGRDIVHSLEKFLAEAQHTATKEWSNAVHFVEGSGALQELKRIYYSLFKDIHIPQMLLQTLKEVSGTIKDAVPLEEAKRFISAVVDYIDKKANNQHVDDLNALQNIINLAIQALGKIVDTIIITPKGSSINLPEKSVPWFSLKHLYNIPGLSGLSGIRFSPITYFAQNDFKSMVQALYAFSLNPKHWFPPYELHALIVQGLHIFTFDDKYFTFPASCNYLLVRDAYKGSFSLFGTFTNGILTEITYSDKYDTITIKKGGQLFVNNAPAEYPARKTLAHAYRTYESVNIASKAGFRFVCGPEFMVCGIHVSGYYHSDLRGLLGNGDNEPFDDFILPNGKIITSETEFSSNYQVGASCPPVKPVDYKTPNPAYCKWFNNDSPLSLCYKFVNPENYRKACQYGLANQIPDTEKITIMGYVAACRDKYIPVDMPKEFVQCTNDAQPYSVGDTFSVKVPLKAADIVLVVDQDKSNEEIYKELTQQLVQQLTTVLSSHGITDVQYHVIGYGGAHQKYPSHYTVGGELTFKGRLPNVEFSHFAEPAPFIYPDYGFGSLYNLVRVILHELKILTLQTPSAKAYISALKFPFRPHAAKAIIGFNSEQCDSGLGLVKLLPPLPLHDRSILLNTVTPFAYFNTKNPKDATNVIGFNKNGVFTFTEAIKKPQGSSELLNDLEYDNVCADYVLKHHGNVFVGTNFKQAKPPQKKQFSYVAAQNIAHQLASVEHGLDCRCSLVTAYTAENVCKLVYTREKELAETPSTKKDGHKG